MIKKVALLSMALISYFIIGCSTGPDESEFISNDNAIVSFRLNADSEWMPVEVYQDSLIFQSPGGFKFTDVRADYVLTDNSTISPDPDSIKDWSVQLEFTLTAPDGITTRNYIYKPRINNDGVEGFYSLNSQADVDAFTTKKLTKVFGISINGTKENPITDLSALNTLKVVEFQLNINNFQGKQLNGLNNLERVANLNISGDSLETLHLDALKEVNNLTVGYYGTSAEPSKAPKLKAIYWNKLKVIHNSLIVSVLSLETFEGFSSLESIGGEATIRAGAPTLLGLDKLNKVYNLTLVLPNVISLEGLGNLTTIDRELRLSFLNKLRTLDGSNINAVKYLNINNCTNLSDIKALRNIEELDVLFFSGLRNVTSLEGLHNLKRIKNSMEFVYLSELTNLDDLQSLEGVGGSIAMRYCYALKDYCGISNTLQSFNGTWAVTSNGYSPTLEQVKTNCKQ
ncbi:MAG: hypothetical protein ACK5L5_01800 [Bacteroidales bacterium]